MHLSTIKSISNLSLKSPLHFHLFLDGSKFKFYSNGKIKSTFASYEYKIRSLLYFLSEIFTFFTLERFSIKILPSILDIKRNKSAKRGDQEEEQRLSSFTIRLRGEAIILVFFSLSKTLFMKDEFTFMIS